MSPTGVVPARAGGAIYVSLRGVERRAGGRAYPDNVGFRVNLPHRASDPDSPKVYRRGDVAEAEPAVHGRATPVDELFDQRRSHKYPSGLSRRGSCCLTGEVWLIQLISRY
jgi:hypothetical protein